MPCSAAVARHRNTLTDYRITELTNKLAGTFFDWQKAYVYRIVDLDAAERYAAGVLLTMAISERDDLVGICLSSAVYESLDGPVLEWTRPDGRRGARLLSCLVALSIDAQFDPGCGGRFLNVLESSLRKLDPGLLNSEDPVGAALVCSEAWCVQELSEFFSHLSGDLPMTPLPRSAFARLECKHALTEHFQLDTVDEDSAVTAISGFLQSRGDDSGEKTLKDIISSTQLHDVESKTNKQLCEDLAAAWRGKIDVAEIAGPLTCLQLACALQMAYAGTHKPATIVGYVRAGFPVIHDALAGVELVQLSSAELSTRLAKALEKVEGQNRRNARAYLGHLWRFAREWIDVEPLLPSLLPEVEVAAIDANVIWEHEGQVMDKWLDGPQPDPELAMQTKLVRRLMATLKARAAEIFFLQVRNVHVYEDKDYVDVEIVSRGRLHGLKSKDAQRMARVTGPLAAELLGQVNRRLVEDGDLGRHLLFGTKAEPERVYRLSAMYRWLNRAVKAATGDPNSCCHHFRHSAIDSTYATLTLNQIAAGALEQLRVDAGHLDLRSTQRSYLHRFPRILREAADASLAEFVPLSDSKTAAWVGISAANLRKIRSRNSSRLNSSRTVEVDEDLSSTSDWYWAVLHSEAHKKTFQPASNEFLYCCPLPPKSLGAHRPWTTVDLLGFLMDLAQGCSPSQACHQRRLPIKVGDVAAQELLALAQEKIRTGRNAIDVEITTAAAALSALGLRPVAAFQPKYKTWLEALSQSQSLDMTDAVWEAWCRSTRNHYIKLKPIDRPDRWLAYVLASGMPSSKLVVCIDDRDPTLGIDIRRMVRTVSALSIAAGSGVRYQQCDYNDRRGHCYLLVADEAETLSNHTGAAFTTVGLKVIFIAMRLASLARAVFKECKL